MSASPVSGKSQWSEYKNSEGRTYWSHSVTKQSVWEKPDELRTPFERALSKTSWKQYTSKDRPYYVNSETKETKWDLPPDLVDLKKKVERDEAFKAEKARRKLAGEPSPSPPRSRSGSPAGAGTVARYGFRRASPTPSDSSDEEVITFPSGGFLTHDKAEEGFFYLLKREKIDETWTWDQTMRKIVLDPLYKGLNTLAEKKEAFEKYTRMIVAKRQAVKDARIQRLRPILHKLFAASPGIKSYSTTKTANELFSRDRNWREARQDEKALILEEYTTEKRRKEEESARELRNRNIQHLGTLIRSLDINVSTPWRAAHNIILGSDEFRNSQDLQEIETIDILGIYDDYSRQLEQEHEEESRRLRIDHVRKARQAREGFKLLLQDLEQKGELTRKAKWKDTYKQIKDDERYHALLGLAGSNPIELWMDAVDDISEELESCAEKIDKVLKERNHDIKVDTTWEQFAETIKDGPTITHIEEKKRREVYDLIIEKMVQAAADESRRAERKRRHRIDDLRYALKKVQRHIDVEMTYEEAKLHMEELQEYKDIEDEEDRKSAFEKYVQRQKEKLREMEVSEKGSTSGRRDDKMDVDKPDKRSRRDDSRDRSRRHESSRDRDGRRSDRKDDRDIKDRGKDRERNKDRDRTKENDRRHRDDDRDKHRDDDRDRRRDDDRRRESGRRRDDVDKERKHRSDRPEADDREAKRPRRSSDSGRRDEVEEGEI